MIEVIVLFVFLTLATWAGQWMYRRYVESRHIQIDINEGIEAALDASLLDMGRLQSDPGRLEPLQGKVSSIALLSEANAEKSAHDQIESIVIDVNGAIHTLEATRDGMDHIFEAKHRDSSNHEYTRELVTESAFRAVAERNADIERNAVWLARKLDVPFEEAN